jgi:hypothetical protein
MGESMGRKNGLAWKKKLAEGKRKFANDNKWRKTFIEWKNWVVDENRKRSVEGTKKFIDEKRTSIGRETKASRGGSQERGRNSSTRRGHS